MAEKLTRSLQESLITLLAMSEAEGAVASGIVDVELFEPPYDDIAARCIQYRKKFKRPPGREHLDDIFDHVLADNKHKQHRLYQSVLSGILDQAPGLNAGYVLSRVQVFIRQQNIKLAIITAAKKISDGGEEASEEAEQALFGALRYKPEPMDSGIFLNDKSRILSILGGGSKRSYAIGIPELDRRQIGPTEAELLGFMAAKGRGKTWFCIEVGVRAMMQSAKVVHYTLENGDEKTSLRYIQRMFAIAKRQEKFERVEFEMDEAERVSGFKHVKQSPLITLADHDLAEKLSHKLDRAGRRLRRILVKQFPTGNLTVSQIEAHLTGLELTENFIPNVVIVDYPDLMRLDRKQEYRLALGQIFKELRGLAVERNVAMICPIQSSREGEDARLLTGKFIGEDYSKGQTADNLITYNQTKQEKKLGIARLYVDKARNDEDGFAVLIAQNYKTGQFCTQSAYMPTNHWDLVKRESGEE